MAIKAGLRFIFNEAYDFELAEAIMGALFPEKFANGEIKVLDGANPIGCAGNVPETKLNEVGGGEPMTLMTEVSDIDFERLKQEVVDVNDKLSTPGHRGPFALVTKTATAVIFKNAAQNQLTAEAALDSLFQGIEMSSFEGVALHGLSVDLDDEQIASLQTEIDSLNKSLGTPTFSVLSPIPTLE